MHEASLINDLIGKISTVAAEQNAQKVVGVEVWLGALCHMSADHFREHFEQASSGTIAEGADLDVDVSTDTSHADALHIVLMSVEVE